MQDQRLASAIHIDMTSPFVVATARITAHFPA
jgi:hypothetical protein